MMYPYEAAQKIIGMMPAAQPEVQRALAKSSFALIRVFTGNIRQLVSGHEAPLMDQALILMDEIYSEGDKELQLAIENIFIYSLETLAAQTDCSTFWSHMPANLYQAYVKQICKSTI